MTKTPITWGAAGRNCRRAAVLSAATAVSVVALAAPAHAAPDDARGGMHGDPAAAAPYWRYQRQDLDCGEMAVADVIGQITGREPSEDEITGAAANIPSTSHGGPIYTPTDRTSNRDLPVLLAHYGVSADAVNTSTGALERALDGGRKVIAGVNDKTLWDEGGNRTKENHFVVVTGIDTGGGVVHVNDSGIRAGRDEQVSTATFEAAWATSGNLAIVTR